METEGLVQSLTGNTSEDPINILLDAALISKPAPPECIEGAQLILGALGDTVSTLLQVGNYCRIHGATFSEYHSLLIENRARLEEGEPALELDERTRNMYGSITTLYQSLEETDQTFLRIISLYDPSGASLDLFQAPVESDFKDAYDILPRDEGHQQRLATLRRTLSPDNNWDKTHVKGLVDTLQSIGLVSWSSSEDEIFVVDSQLYLWLGHTFPVTKDACFLRMAEALLASHQPSRYPSTP